MNIGEKLYDLRKEKHLSQEEVAEKLNVTRQTISKWETNASTPDFDKIKPLCELYGVTADELLTGQKREFTKKENKEEIKQKRALGIGIGVLLYFVAIVWMMISIPVLFMNPIVASALFLLICGLGTCVIIYTCIKYKKEKTKTVEEPEEKNPLIRRINNIIDTTCVIIYLIISFATMAWYITWIIFIIDGLIKEIVKLAFDLKEEKEETNEEE